MAPRGFPYITSESGQNKWGANIWSCSRRRQFVTAALPSGSEQFVALPPRSRHLTGSRERLIDRSSVGRRSVLCCAASAGCARGRNPPPSRMFTENGQNALPCASPASDRVVTSGASNRSLSDPIFLRRRTSTTFTPPGLLRPRSNFCSETSWRSHVFFTSPPRIQTPCKIRTFRSSTDHPSNSSCRRVRSRRSRSPNHHEEHLGSLSLPPINRTNQAAFLRLPEAAPSVIAPRAT